MNFSWCTLQWPSYGTYIFRIHIYELGVIIFIRISALMEQTQMYNIDAFDMHNNHSMLFSYVAHKTPSEDNSNAMQNQYHEYLQFSFMLPNYAWYKIGFLLCDINYS